MLKKQNRLKNKKDFDEIFKRGKSFGSKILFLKIKDNKLNYNRFGFIVSQKVAKKAVVRNKIKRRLREIIRKENEKIKPGWDIVLIALPGIEKEEFTSLKEQINYLIKNAFKNN